jgi:type III secretion protein Q
MSLDPETGSETGDGSGRQHTRETRLARRLKSGGAMLSDASQLPTTVARLPARTDPSPLRRLSMRRLTRTHLALAERPQVGEEARQAVSAVAEALQAQLGCEVVLELALQQRSGTPAELLSRLGAFALFDLGAVGARAVLELERPMLSAILARAGGLESGSGPLHRLTRAEEAAFGFLALVALRAVREVGSFERRYAPRLLSVHLELGELLQRLDGGAAHLTVAGAIRVGAVRGQVSLLLPARAVQSGLGAGAPPHPAELSKELSAVRLPVRPRVGRARLSHADATSLTAGDVVLLDELSLAGGRAVGPVRLVAPGFTLFGEATAGGVAFTRAVHRAVAQEHPMSMPLESAHLPVDVEVELTRLRVPLSELAALKVGTTLPLHLDATSPVALRVGDRVVALAELVELEHEIGARIVALASGGADR